MDATPAVMITLVPLAAAMLALYTPYRNVAFALLLVSVIAALYVGVITSVGVLAATILLILCYFSANTRDARHKRTFCC